MMVRRLMIAAVVVASSAAGLLTAGAGGSTTGSALADLSRGCPALPAFARGAPGLVSGRGLWAVAGGRLVSIGAGRVVTGEGLSSVGVRRPATSLGRATLRHLALRPGVGTAYVIDRVGADVVVAVTPEGVDVLPQVTEALHPAWSASGRLAWSTGSSIVVRDPVTGETDELPAPVHGARVFAPVFQSDRRVAAVVSTPIDGGVPDGEQSGDLWATDVGGTRWRQLTHFRAESDMWVTIRTPVARAGGIDLVRVSGRGSSTEAPRFELWRYEDGAAVRVRRLDGERYLAGSLRGRLLWSRPDPTNGRHLLQVERAGTMHTIGCGAVLVDPIDVADPDRRGGGSYVPLRGDQPDAGEGTGASADEVAVIVGDFETSVEAEAVAVEIRRTYPGSVVDVVGNDEAPLAIRPGVFGALLHLPHDADPSAAIADFRTALPAYTPNSWIVTP
ncbi:MAG: hypothetical protein ACRDG8_07175 [Actinomycetota bacterium]